MAQTTAPFIVLSGGGIEVLTARLFEQRNGSAMRVWACLDADEPRQAAEGHAAPLIRQPGKTGSYTTFTVYP